MRSSILLLALVVSCSGDPSLAPARQPVSVTATVAHRDDRLDVPSFLWLHGASGAADAKGAAAVTLRAIAPQLRLDGTAQAATQLVGIHDVGRGPLIAEWRQAVDGVEVFRARFKVAMTRDLRPVVASGLLAPSLQGATTRFFLGDDAAVGVARAAFGDPAAAWRHKRVFFPLKGDRLEPAHYVELTSKQAMRSYVISAIDGRVLFDNDLVHHEAYTYRVYADPDSLLPYDGPYGTAGLPHPTGKADGYRPGYVPAQHVTLDHFPFSKGDPWLPNGAGQTTGNNVDAYADLVAPDGASPGDERAQASGTSFDDLYDVTKSPGATVTNIRASVVQLFYVMNFMHDWMYDAGFDEMSGNPQKDNLGRGGAGNDPLLAEAQDYSGLNNANAGVPSDGASPRIQMYIFSGTSVANLQVTAPAAIAGTKPVAIAGFGSAAQFDLTGDVVLAQDDTGMDVNDGCEPLTNNVTGKIALIHRGLCSFVQKVQNAQNAGAIGAIVANVASSADPTVPPFMGGSSSTVTIPSLSLALADGMAIENALTGTVTVLMHKEPETNLDGGLDTNVSSHEWGHVLSNRLVGDANGLTTNQAGGLGEGWSDFVALLLTTRPDDPDKPGGAGWSGVYPSGAYATAGQGSDYYFGIRRVPYSTRLDVDPLTFQHIQNGTPLPTTAPTSFGEDGSFNSEVHNTGEVWATMLWECYAGLLREKKMDFRTAQETMKRYLVASLKLTPVDPTLLEARDAVLAAALATDEADYRIFWRAFARRGAGVGAVGPGKDSTDNKGVSESYAAGNDAQLSAVAITDDLISCDHDGLIDEGEKGTLMVTVRNDGTGTLTEARLIASSIESGVAFDQDGVFAVPTLEPLMETMVKIPVRMHGVTPVTPIVIDVQVVDASFAVPRAIQVALPTRFSADEAPDSSNVDHVDTVGTSWTAQGFDGDTWDRVHEGNEAWWGVVDSNLQSDHELRSAAFTIEGTSFSLSWKHRWQFRRSQRRMVDIDGGVVEISTDDGNSWDDLSMYGTVDYNTTLDPTRTTNVLAGRKAYGNTSANYPTEWVASHVDVTLPAHPDHVMVRFRMGTAGGGFAANPGWELDDVALDGISSKPFWSFVAHRDACDPAAPVADAGKAQDVREGQVVQLDGRASTGSHFQWLWVSGTYAKLEGADTATPSFVAPKSDEPIVFALRVDDGTLLSPPATVAITVHGGRGCSASGSGEAPISVTLVLLCAALVLRRSR